MKRLILAILMVLVSMIGMVGVSSVAAGVPQELQALQQQLQQILQSMDSLRGAVEAIPGTWSQILPASTRFVLVMNGEAVLDKETGLVWEKSPDNTAMQWYVAQHRCYNLNVSGRKGWRLPTAEELASLVDPSVSSGPKLPSGHPFTNVQAAGYWTGTTAWDDELPDPSAWIVEFLSGSSGAMEKIPLGIVHTLTWCVRGGHGHDTAVHGF